MSPVLHAFPQRALRLKSGRGLLRGLGFMLAGVLVLGGVIAFAVFEIVPPIRSDFQVRDTAIASRDARMVTGRCRTHLFLLHDCKVTLRYAAKGTTVERQVQYIFLAPGGGDFTVQARVDPQRPDLITSDLGLDHLWSRVVMATFITVVGVLASIAALIVGWLAVRGFGGTQGVSGRSLQPVVAQFVASGRGPSWTVRDENGAEFTWQVRRGDKPFLLDPSRGLVLALREGPGAPVFPLDARLRLVDLTGPERQRILAAQAASAPAA